jgi:hypothetical protein
MTSPRLVLLELNEFHPGMLQKAARELELAHVQKLFSLHPTRTWTADTSESDHLEPWVQWVSVHTGKPSQAHGIKHLGDVPRLGHRQLWEVLSEKGISSGIWGAMNAARRGARHCSFFLPDPWTFSEEAYPSRLDALLAFPRYVAKNHMNLDKKHTLTLALRFARLFLRPELAGELARELPRLVAGLARFRGANFVGFCFAEYFSTLLFVQHLARYEPRFGLLFINSVAHLQHYYWDDDDYRNNVRFAYGLRYVDKLVGAVLQALRPDDVLLVMNALSQETTAGERRLSEYRQIDHARLFAAAGIACDSAEALMTHDAHVQFADTAARDRAAEALLHATVDGRQLFDVEKDRVDPRRLWYRIHYKGPATSETIASIGGRSLRFGEYFQFCGHQSGKHVPDGIVLCNRAILPREMPNHEVFQHVLDHFGATQEPRPESAPARPAPAQVQ